MTLVRCRRVRLLFLRRLAPSMVVGGCLCLQLGAGVSAQPAEVELAPEKQKHIWNLEHASFVIEAYFGKAFTRALREGDRDALRAVFLPQATAEVPASSGTERSAGELASESNWSAVSGRVQDVDANGLVEHLLGYLAEFARIDGLKLQVLEIDTASADEDRWIAHLRLSALGAAAGGGPVEHLSKHRVELRFTEDEEVKRGDAIVRRFQVRFVQSRKAPRVWMEEVTEPVGLAAIPLPDNWKLPTNLARTHRYQFAVEDYDRDGYPDIAVSATNGRPLLLRSLGGKSFEDVTGRVGLRPSDDSPRERMLNALVGWIDYDNDSYPDLLMGYRLYHNEGGKRFVPVPDSGLYFDRSPFGCVVADFDRDGRLDLYIVNQKGFRQRPPGKRPWVGDLEAGTENHLWRNLGGGRFADVTAKANAGGGRHQTFAGAPLFFDDDPAPDLYLANDFGPNVLLRNRGDGSFEDVTEGTGTGDFATSMGVAAGDLDNDGNPEIYVANMYSKMGRRIVSHVAREDYPPGLYEMIRGSLAGNRLYRIAGDGPRYDELSEQLGVNQVGWAFAPVMVDLDADGWLDLYATAGFSSTDREKPDG